jgi:hypothetical protein
MAMVATIFLRQGEQGDFWCQPTATPAEHEALPMHQPPGQMLCNLRFSLDLKSGLVHVTSRLFVDGQ